jgi:hypothetical protein
MEIDKESIKEFREIYKKEFNEEIDEVTAQKKARQLLELLKLIRSKNEPRR